MRRWRKSTWAFIGWNVLMVVWVGSRLSDDSCVGLECLNVLFELLMIGSLWLIGVLVIGVAWLRNRARDGAPGAATSSDVWSVAGSDAEAVLAQGAATVVERRSHGKSLVEAAWMSTQESPADSPLLLNVAFGDPGVRYWALWPHGEDAMEALLAHVPGVSEQG